MGFKFSDDGECAVCGMHTNKFCDSCKSFICDEHRIEVPIEHSFTKRVYCRKCYERGRQPTNATMKGLHPEYHF